MRNNKSAYRVSFAAILAVSATVVFFVGVEDKTLALLYSLVCWVPVLIIHILSAARAERVVWGDIVLPVFVLDWGPYGKDIAGHVPENVRDIPVFFCPPNEVRQTEAFVRVSLTESENPYYVRPTDPAKVLPVYVRFFRDPKTGTGVETGEEYLARIFETMQQAKQAWLLQLRNSASPADYENLFFIGVRNGSARA